MIPAPMMLFDMLSYKMVAILVRQHDTHTTQPVSLPHEPQEHTHYPLPNPYKAGKYGSSFGW